ARQPTAPCPRCGPDGALLELGRIREENLAAGLEAWRSLALDLSGVRDVPAEQALSERAMAGWVRARSLPMPQGYQFRLGTNGEVCVDRLDRRYESVAMFWVGPDDDFEPGRILIEFDRAAHEFAKHLAIRERAIGHGHGKEDNPFSPHTYE